MRRLAWLVVIVLAVVAVLFGADYALRVYAEQRMEAEIAQALPDGVTVPGLKVDVRGFSFIAQYLSGTFDQVEVDAPAIDTSRGSVSASLVAGDVRIDRSFAKPPVLGTVHGTIHVSESAVNSLVALPDPSASILLSEKTVTYTATTQVLGLPLSYSAAVRPVADGKIVRLYPQAVNVTSGPVHFDVKSLLGGVFDGKPINVCIAPYIPLGLDVGDITIARSAATIEFHAEDFALSEGSFTSHAACPAT
ncbi:MAG: DUF2993 domain-containing protein [Microbacteriaceae bacterium]|nr:DUF2993 domain-containing protein [Microbacteriaceae bacterium]MCL2794686.1 DUF2993 domain-containing protein [Microbacteriaceae bacterium]